jgi:hypothetical protein
LTDNEIVKNDNVPSVANAGQRPASRLDMQRVTRWAELLDGDPQARDFMRERLAGGELSQLGELTLRQRRLELALEHGIPAQLAEVHLTAADPQLLEAQAESLARLINGVAIGSVGAAHARPENSNDSSTTGRPWAAPTVHPQSPISPLPAYEAAPVDREEWLQAQFVQLYQH